MSKVFWSPRRFSCVNVQSMVDWKLKIFKFRLVRLKIKNRYTWTKNYATNVTRELHVTTFSPRKIWNFMFFVFTAIHQKIFVFYKKQRQGQLVSSNVLYLIRKIKNLDMSFICAHIFFIFAASLSPNRLCKICATKLYNF